MRHPGCCGRVETTWCDGSASGAYKDQSRAAAAERDAGAGASPGSARRSALETIHSLVVELSELHPLLQGVIATLLAGFALAAWISIGSFFIETSAELIGTALPLSSLIGTALTAATFAVFTRIGVIDG